MRILLISQGLSTATGTGTYSAQVIRSLKKHINNNLLTYDIPYNANNDDWNNLLSFIKNNKPDVIQILQIRPRHLYPISKITKGFKTILTVHNLSPEEAKLPFIIKSSKLYFALRNIRYLITTIGTKYLLKHNTFHSIVCVSDYSLKRVKSITGRKMPLYKVTEGYKDNLNEDKTTSNSREIDSEIFHLKESKASIVLTVAGFIYHKGIYEMIKILAEIKKENIKFKYIVVGNLRDPKYYQFLVKQIKYYNLENDVILKPDVNEDTLNYAYEIADIYVQPSFEEAFCLSFLDASIRVPKLLGAKVGEIPSILKLREQSDNSFDPRDNTTLRNKLKGLLINEDPDKYAIDKKTINKIKTTYSWDNVAKELLAIYKKLV